jgi:hypothetical protein
MGLDGVELVIGLEDTFGVSISDAAAAKMTTVGITAKHIAQLLAAKPSTDRVCSTARSFYGLRRELSRRFEVPRDGVKLDTPIGALVPQDKGRDWQEIADASGLWRERRFLFRRRVPPPEMTVRQLIEDRCKTKWRRFDGSIDEGIVFEIVRRIVSEQMNVPIEKIGHDTRYIEDLGIG